MPNVTEVIQKDDKELVRGQGFGSIVNAPMLKSVHSGKERTDSTHTHNKQEL